MQKLDIATRIYQQAGIPMDEAAKLLDFILGLLKTTIQAGEPIVIAGFGKFTVRNKLARIGRNPQTGEAVTISARRVVTFHASPLLKEQVNSPSEETGAAESEGIGALPKQGEEPIPGGQCTQELETIHGRR